MRRKLPEACTIVSLVLVATGTATAKPFDIIVSAGTVSPSTSPYRRAANAVGYAESGITNAYEAEAALLFPLAFRGLLVAGPVARVDWGFM